MTDVNENKPPVWFWIVSGLAFVFNAYGVWDCYNSISLNEAYLAAYPGYLEYVMEMPTWAKGAWGLGTGASFLAAICFLLRKAWAWPLYILALLGMIGAFGYQLLVATNNPMMTTGTIFVTIAIITLSVLLAIFAKTSTAKGWLR